MKKLVKLLCCSLVLMLCIISSAGCSCSKKALKVNFYVTLQNANPEDYEMLNIKVGTSLLKKFREPANTPCYEKIDDQYVLIPNAEGVSACYDSEGNKFEKATYNSTDIMEIGIPYYPFTQQINPITEKNPISTYTSDFYEVPENENYSLIYVVEIHNYEYEPVYVKELDVKDIVGDLIKEASINKITYSVPNEEYTHSLGGDEFYKVEERTNLDVILSKNSSVRFEIHLKGLTNQDTIDNLKEVTFNIPLVVKK